jgi:hypothetical protein
VAERTTPARTELARRPSFRVSLLTIICSVLLMLLKALADIIWTEADPPATRRLLDFIGEPFVAMTIAVLVAMATFGYAVGASGAVIAKRIGDSVGPVAAVILIVGAGGSRRRSSTARPAMSDPGRYRTDGRGDQPSRSSAPGATLDVTHFSLVRPLRGIDRPP